MKVSLNISSSVIRAGKDYTKTKVSGEKKQLERGTEDKEECTQTEDKEISPFQ